MMIVLVIGVCMLFVVKFRVCRMLRRLRLFVIVCSVMKIDEMMIDVCMMILCLM